MVELSNLARKSGYELVLNDIIRDHRNAISGMKSRLSELKKAGNKNEGRVMVYVIIIFVVQGALLLLSLFRTARAPSPVQGNIPLGRTDTPASVKKKAGAGKAGRGKAGKSI